MIYRCATYANMMEFVDAPSLTDDEMKTLIKRCDDVIDNMERESDVEISRDGRTMVKNEILRFANQSHAHVDSLISELSQPDSPEAKNNIKIILSRIIVRHDEESLRSMANEYIR